MSLTFLPHRDLRNIKPLGVCAYCGSTDSLTREHVIPRGMAGSITLPQGSCVACAKIIHPIETSCLRSTLFQIRWKHDLQKHVAERPTTLKVTVTDRDGGESIIEVSPADFPTLWTMLILEYPGLLLGKQPEATNFGMLYAHTDGAAYQRLIAATRAKSISVTSGAINAAFFARWIAKIGYGYAVAYFGLDAVKHSPLVDLIINGSSHYNHLIGGLNGLSLPSQEFSLEPPASGAFTAKIVEARSSGGEVYNAGWMRLLPMLQGPTYLAVVCRKP
jgi:hypothetical protein